MKFVDETEIEVRGGNGGPGCISFLREKYRPNGGPDGGNGGDGGSVILTVDTGLSTLLDFRYQRLIEAPKGEQGRGKEQHGHGGADKEVRVPLGTVVRDAVSGEILADLNTVDATVVIARGGRGGRGNATYATSTNQAPRRAQPGIPGEERRLRLELRLLADVGLVGFPNAGKSTLISRVSAAKPRVADYPFTTLVPHLGVVRFAEEATFVLADIPGLIEGAHTGHGLGLRFLRHLTRTSLLIHLLDAGGLSGRDPLDDYDIINRELAHFDAGLAAKPQIVVANKIDLCAEPAQLEALRERFAARGIALRLISGATGEGVTELMQEAGTRALALRRAAAEANAAEVVEHG